MAPVNRVSSVLPSSGRPVSLDDQVNDPDEHDRDDAHTPPRWPEGGAGPYGIVEHRQHVEQLHRLTVQVSNQMCLLDHKQKE